LPGRQGDRVPAQRLGGGAAALPLGGGAAALPLGGSSCKGSRLPPRLHIVRAL